MKNTGIYKIVNLNNGKVYVGSAARSFSQRWRVHKSRLHSNTHHSKKLQASWNLHGEDMFVFEIIENCAPEDCIAREQFWIDEFNSFKDGYNCRPEANSQLGFKHSPENVAKMLERNKAWRPTEEQRTKSAKSRLGLKKSEEAKRKLSAAKKGKPGRVWSQASKDKLSASITGRKCPATSEKLSMPVVGVSVTSGEILAFSSTKSATDFGFTSGAVSRACRRDKDYPRGVHKGYLWNYVNNKE